MLEAWTPPVALRPALWAVLPLSLPAVGVLHQLSRWCWLGLVRHSLALWWRFRSTLELWRMA